MAGTNVQDDVSPEEIAWRWSAHLAKWSFFIIAISVAISSIVWKPER